MSKKKDKMTNEIEIKKEDITNENEVKKEKKSIGETLKNISGIFSSLFKKKAKDNDEEGSSKKLDEEPEEKKPRKPFPFKEILIVIGLSAVLSITILFVMDMGGLRSSMRSGLTDFLLGMEKKLLTEQLESQYQSRVDEELAQLLVAERENLVLEYETLESSKVELEKGQKALSKSEDQIQTRLDALEAEKERVLEQQAILEGKISEIEDLVKIYENMEPENAANIMTEMENETLMLGILGNMKEDNAAEILELMETSKAADILSKMGE